MQILKDLNDKQIEAVENIDSPLLILAGAGSGKTRVITYKISYLLEKGFLPSEILVLFISSYRLLRIKNPSILLSTPFWSA